MKWNFTLKFIILKINGFKLYCKKKKIINKIYQYNSKFKFNIFNMVKGGDP